MEKLNDFNIKKYLWWAIPLIAFGGLFYPKLGLSMLLIMGIIIGVGLFNGKYWCGNLCPHASLFDNILKPRSFSRELPKIFKSKVFKWGFFTFYMIMFIVRIIRVSSGWGSDGFWDNLGFLFVIQYLVMPTILGSSLAILISPRTWCHVCPMGTMGQVMDKVGSTLKLNKRTETKIQISDKDDCLECGLCTKACPMGLEPHKNFNEGNIFDHPDCIKCGACINSCPVNILSLDKTDIGGRETDIGTTV
ncbi:4Fe-4S binding protein [Halonatronum saccharophilum]|uniref:4Fe-4S binding protein n=1 Tax=Halonatronum saccharophilum TaxID=150060 RepID=UPI0004B90283|nr:4Fe-4S binding protein [Halonatronum saccharophilum]